MSGETSAAVMAGAFEASIEIDGATYRAVSPRMSAYRAFLQAQKTSADDPLAVFDTILNLVSSALARHHPECTLEWLADRLGMDELPRLQELIATVCGGEFQAAETETARVSEGEAADAGAAEA